MPLLKRFYQDPYLQFRAFCINLGVSAVLCALLYGMRAPEFYRYEFAWWHPLLALPGVYIGGLSAVFIHNATHGSFRPRWLNRWAGELAGMHQMWGFIGWKLIHLVHHHYSDNIEMDPHPPGDLSFWQFLRVMFRRSAAKISERYQEHWGDTKRTQMLQQATYAMFLLLVAVNVAFWFLLLGPVGFVWFYVPSYLYNHWFFAHINYIAHPKDEAGQTAAANLNHNWYYKIANVLWFGIYYHGNHHRKPQLFNPRKMAVRRISKSEPIIY